MSLAATLLLPAFILHGRAIAEILISSVGLCFLARSTITRDWTWLRPGWMRLALAYWVWVSLCSMPGHAAGGWRAFGLAVSFIRFPLFVAALEHAVLREPAARRWLGRVVTAAALYIGLQSALQFATGRDLQGFPRGADGELTGPFKNPRAGLPLSRLIFPTMLPPVAGLLARGRRGGAAALAVVSVGMVALIGQRMPMLLTVFGLAVAGLMLRRLRAVVGVALVAGLVVVGASAVISPPTFHRLVTKFSSQMENFADSDYGLIAGRAVAITEAHPWLGEGFDGFRHACADPRYFEALPWAAAHAADGGGAAACNIHPHNHYLEAATNGGLPGLLLFTALIVAWLMSLARGLGRDPDPLRAGLFVAALIQEWPIASMGGFTAIEFGGWFFLLLGWGLAEARWRGDGG